MLDRAEFDIELMARWIPPLTLIDWKMQRVSFAPGSVTASPMGALHALFRPLFDPDAMRISGKSVLTAEPEGSRASHKTAVRTILNLILQNQVDQAIALARRRYLAAGLMTVEVPNGMSVDSERLAAALIVPVNSKQVAQRFEQYWILPKTDLNGKENT
jgi:CRISPR-associated protein Csx17